MKRLVPTVSGAVFNPEGKLLLTLRSEKVLCPGTWCLPGGRLVGGDDWLTTLRKEVQEEVGLRVVEQKLIGIYSDPKVSIFHVDEGTLHFLAASFLVTSFSGEVQPNDEVCEWGWFSESELPEPLLVTEPMKIRDAFRFRGEVSVR